MYARVILTSGVKLKEAGYAVLGLALAFFFGAGDVNAPDFAPDACEAVSSFNILIFYSLVIFFTSFT